MTEAPDKTETAEEHGHEHPPHLAHHYDTTKQQFEAAKLGMWLFLVTEVLLFGGLFVWYSVMRSLRPEIFFYGSQFLDPALGGLNTIVLICSSLTMAWAVRTTQLGKTGATSVLLTITLLCALTFLCVKYVEYSAKWKHGLLWGKRYQPTEHVEGHGGEHAEEAAAEPGGGAGVEAGEKADPDRPRIAPAAVGPGGLLEPGESEAVEIVEHPTLPRPKNVHLFFGIYFVMTGLHGVHVIAGMVMIFWLLLRTRRGHFGPDYFTPVDLGGLYWHVVDIVWIFLFPLLYLIH